SRARGAWQCSRRCRAPHPTRVRCTPAPGPTLRPPPPARRPRPAPATPASRTAPPGTRPRRRGSPPHTAGSPPPRSRSPVQPPPRRLHEQTLLVRDPAGEAALRIRPDPCLREADHLSIVRHGDEDFDLVRRPHATVRHCLAPDRPCLGPPLRREVGRDLTPVLAWLRRPQRLPHPLPLRGVAGAGRTDRDGSHPSTLGARPGCPGQIPPWNR